MNPPIMFWGQMPHKSYKNTRSNSVKILQHNYPTRFELVGREPFCYGQRPTLFFYVPFRAWPFKALHNFLPFATLIYICRFTILPTPRGHPFTR